MRSRKKLWVSFSADSYRKAVAAFGADRKPCPNHGCLAMQMQMQMEKLMDKKKGFFKWRKLGIMPLFKSSRIFLDRGRSGNRLSSYRHFGYRRSDL
ncbi:hypothetical protein V6N11_064287 [Hibiscus sabdariffa]|uniref:Uncharacterized protein n=1 Tax=Hibiscus sabdariffa TaxID=183260 RepID=A0ABR2PN63_9ROSI